MRKRAHLKILLLLAVVLLLFMRFRPRGAPPELGPVDGKLRDCPPKPNCICTHASDPGKRMEPIPLGSATDPIATVRRLLEATEGAQVVSSTDVYLRAEFTTRLLRFVDDVEFLVDPSTRLMHYRSASRIGHSDFGTNGRRMAELRARILAELGK